MKNLIYCFLTYFCSYMYFIQLYFEPRNDKNKHNRDNFYYAKAVEKTINIFD